MKSIIMRRPRKPRALYLWTTGPAYENCGLCDVCMANFQTQVDNERPGHVWSVQDGKVVYMEDAVMEKKLGRPLKSNETVIHANGDILDNRQENLEIVSIDGLE